MSRVALPVIVVLLVAGGILWYTRDGGEGAGADRQSSRRAGAGSGAGRSSGASGSDPRVQTAEPVVFQPGRAIVDGKPDEWGEVKFNEVGALSEGVQWSDREDTRLHLQQLTRGERQWTGVAFGCDGENLYVLLRLSEGVGERYRRTRSTGAFGWIDIDSDGDAATGRKETVGVKTIGCDFKVWMPTGFAGGTDRKSAPLASYEVLRLLGPEESEEIPGGEKDSIDQPDFISFAGKFVEMRLPLSLVEIEPPARANFYVDSMDFATIETIISAEFPAPEPRDAAAPSPASAE